MINTAKQLSAALIGAAATLCLALFPATAQRPAPLPDLDPILREQRVESVSVALVRQGRIVALRASGTAGPNRRATVNTPYNLASLTKPLTAEIVLRMVSQRRLSLDEAMDAYWREPDLAQDPRRHLLTARLALSHRTGLPNWRADSGLVFDHDPGSVWGYSGEGYQYAARYAASKSGQPFERLAQQWLFTPARMTQSGYITSQGRGQPVATAHDGDGNAIADIPVLHYNAADLAHATARDYARFLIDVLYNRHLTPEVAQERNRIEADITAQVCSGTKAASCPPQVGYGLGWQLLAFPAGTVMMHTGKDEGVFTFAAIDRSNNAAIVILTNSDNGWKVILPILEQTHFSPALIAYLRGQMA